MSDIKLPELPKRFDNICALNECGDIEEVQVYTAEQMQEYAKQAAEDAVRELRKRLEDPHMVHVAMLRGEIGTPDIRDMLHVHGADALSRWDRAEQAAEMEREGCIAFLMKLHEQDQGGHNYFKWAANQLRGTK